MKCQHVKAHCLLLTFFLMMCPLLSHAGWQVTTPEATPPREPFFQAGRNPTIAPIVPTVALGTTPAACARGLPSQYAHSGLNAAIYAVSISGSLKENLERIMSRYRWRVVWKAPYDYNFDGRVTGSSLPNVVQKLLQPFPLQAVMYMSNRTLAIVPRENYKA